MFLDIKTGPTAPCLCKLDISLGSVASKPLAALHVVEWCSLADIFQQQAGSKAPIVTCVGSRQAGPSLTGGEQQPAGSRGVRYGQEEPKAGRARPWGIPRQGVGRLPL